MEKPTVSSSHAKSDRGSGACVRSQGKASRRIRQGYIAMGLASLLWVGLRSGTRPHRLVYPCQRTAAANALSLLAYAASLLAVPPLASTRLYRWARTHLTTRRMLPRLLGLALVALSSASVNRPLSLIASPALPEWKYPGALSDVFAVTHVPVPEISLEGGAVPPGTPAAAALSDRGVDALVDLMSAHGTSFYRTAHHPDGLFGREDVVVLKVNAQWNCGTGADNRRAHTNTDVVKGVIYRLVQHPDGFAGAVIVAENGQGVPARFDCADANNAQDGRQSYQDVVDAFAGEGYDVCTYLWDDIRRQPVLEYGSGDLEDGYVFVQDGEPGANQLSYPKFEVQCGTQRHRLSMRYGLWDGGEYDETRLKMINLPVLKRHGMAGATIAVKNYIGFLSTADRATRFGDFSELHNFFWGYDRGSDYGLLGRQLALIRRADLNIVDAIWVNPVDGWHNEEAAVRDDVLLASTDPFALDYYSSVYVLVPHMAPGSSWARDADAREHGGDFRGLLVTNENRARSKGMVDTIDLDDGFTAEEELAQFNAYVANASEPLDFSLSIAADPIVRTIVPGEVASYRLRAGASKLAVEPVVLSVEGAPTEANVSLAPNPVAPPGDSWLGIVTTAQIEPGLYPMVVTGESGPVSATVDVTLIVASPVPSLILSLSPTALVTLPGRVVYAEVSVAQPDGPLEEVYLYAGGLPAGVGATWSENPILTGSSCTLTLSLSSGAALGDYLLSVVGKSATQVATAQLELKVEVPPLFLPLVFG